MITIGSVVLTPANYLGSVQQILICNGDPAYDECIVDVTVWTKDAPQQLRVNWRRNQLIEKR